MRKLYRGGGGGVGGYSAIFKGCRLQPCFLQGATFFRDAQVVTCEAVGCRETEAVRLGLQTHFYREQPSFIGAVRLKLGCEAVAVL